LLPNMMWEIVRKWQFSFSSSAGFLTVWTEHYIHWTHTLSSSSSSLVNSRQYKHTFKVVLSVFRDWTRRTFLVDCPIIRLDQRGNWIDFQSYFVYVSHEVCMFYFHLKLCWQARTRSLLLTKGNFYTFYV